MAREKPLYRDNLERLNELYPDKEGLSPAEVAAFLGITEKTARGSVQFNKIGRKLFISKASFAR